MWVTSRSRFIAAFIGASGHRGPAALHVTPAACQPPQTSATLANDLAHEPERGHAAAAWRHWNKNSGQEESNRPFYHHNLTRQFLFFFVHILMPYTLHMYLRLCVCSWCRRSLGVSWAVRRWMTWTSSWLQGCYRFSWITIMRSYRCLFTCAMLWKITSTISNHWWVVTNHMEITLTVYIC